MYSSERVRPTPRDNQRRLWTVIASLSIAFVSLAIAWRLQPQQLQLFNPDGLSASVTQAGQWGPFLYIVAITLSVVVSQIPGAPLAVAAGTIWHPAIAGLYTVIGGFSGALIAYGLGRKMGQSTFAALTGKTLRFSTEHGETFLGWMIFTTRLLPVFSFDLISYGAGISGLSLPIYASATFFGMVPSTLFLTYLGGSLHLGAYGLGTISAVFLLLFAGIPVLLHRCNWFDIGTLVQWE